MRHFCITFTCFLALTLSSMMSCGCPSGRKDGFKELDNKNKNSSSTSMPPAPRVDPPLVTSNSLKMEPKKKSLKGIEKKCELIFKQDLGSSAPFSEYQLCIGLEQNGKGTKITYLDAQNALQEITEANDLPMSHFTSQSQLKEGDSLVLRFNIVPTEDVKNVKLTFQLLHQKIDKASVSINWEIDYADIITDNIITAAKLGGGSNNLIAGLELLQGGSCSSQTEKNLLLCNAAELSNGDTSVLEALLRLPEVDVNWRCVVSPLECAATPKIAQFLLDKGAKIDLKGIQENGLLHAAVKKGHKEVIPFWIDRDIDVKLKNKSGETPLHAAARFLNLASTDVITILLDKGADINAVDNGGDTPLGIFLRYADKKENFEKVLKLLLQNGATEKDCLFLFLDDYSDMYLDVLKLLLNQTFVQDQLTTLNSSGNSCLYEAVNNNRTKALELLLEQPGIEPLLTLANKEGRTPLMLAEWENKTEIVKLLKAKMGTT